MPIAAKVSCLLDYLVSFPSAFPLLLNLSFFLLLPTYDFTPERKSSLIYYHDFISTSRLLLLLLHMTQIEQARLGSFYQDFYLIRISQNQIQCTETVAIMKTAHERCSVSLRTTCDAFLIR